MKLQKIKERATPENMDLYLEYLTRYKKNFKIEYSTYFSNIILDDKKIKFNLNNLDNRVFIAAAMIKKDIKECGMNIPEIKKDSLEYFHHNLTASTIYPKIINIDLKAAYATILKNDGFISEKTYNYLMSLDKSARLAAVGILAAKKTSIVFKAGEITGSEFSQSEYSNYFFYAVQRTHQIIKEIEFRAGMNFLFSWVDGIYFYGPDLSPAAILEIEKLTAEISKDIAINLHLKYPEKFTCIEYEKRFFVSFLENQKEKYFNLPKKNERLMQKAVNFFIRNPKYLNK